MTGTPIEIDLELPAALGRPPAEWMPTRRALGLSTHAPIIATGHQASVWHPGILVKYMVARVLADAVGGDIVHLVVDQDVNDFALLELPGRSNDGGLHLVRHSFTMPSREVPTGWQQPFVPEPIPGSWQPALESSKAGAYLIESALRRHQTSENAAQQVACAVSDLMEPLVGRGHMISGSDLLETDCGRFLLQEMADDPQTCAAAYNDAISRVPQAGTPLRILDDRIELPLWRIEPDGRRLKAWDDDLQRAEAGGIRLAPRALTLTAILRLALCDLFIHGTGGNTYDRAMEFWIESWLRRPVQPMAMATGTVRLPFPENNEDLVDVHDALVQERKFFHDPEFEPQHPGPRKSASLALVNNATRGSAGRRAAYRQLHETLQNLRVQRPDQLELLKRQTAAARRQAAQRPIIMRRTWAFPLYPDELLKEMLEECRRRIKFTDGLPMAEKA